MRDQRIVEVALNGSSMAAEDTLYPHGRYQSENRSTDPIPTPISQLNVQIAAHRLVSTVDAEGDEQMAGLASAIATPEV